MNNKTISIIVPVYKIEEYRLRDCLNSIKKQRNEKIEVIVIDDGSPDNCGKICDEIAKNDERFVVIHSDNYGVSHARNIGIQRATSEYLLFVDGDDQLLDDAINIVERYLGWDLVIFDYCVNGKNKHTSEKCAQFEKSDDLGIIQASFIGGLNIDGLSYTGAPWGKVYKRSIIIENSCFFNEQLPRSQDNEFNFRYMNHVSKCLYVERKIYNYTVNKDSAMRKYWKMAYENSTVLLRTIAAEIDMAIAPNICREGFLNFVFSKLRDVIDTNIYHDDNNLSRSERRNKLKEICNTEYFSKCIREKKTTGFSFDSLLLVSLKLSHYRCSAFLIKFRRILKKL